MWRIKNICVCFIAVTILIILVTGRNYNVYGISCISSKETGGSESLYVPRHIHQMFFNITDKTIPERLEKARKTWIYNHPGFKYTLWNSTMIEKLVREKYPQLWDLYRSYSHWVRRADMGRYIVLHEFGGIYIDLDIKSTGRDLNDLFKTFRNTTSVVMYLTNPPVVSNDFMISKPKHAFMKHVICGLATANHWYVLPYVTTMYTTGPMYLHGQFKSYSEKHEIQLLEQPVMNEFVRHITGSSWHQWDGVMIWWIFLHIKYVIIGTLLVLFLVLTWTCRKTIQSTLSKYTRKILACCKRKQTLVV